MGEDEDDLQEYLSIEKEHIDMSLLALEDVLSRDETTIIELSAIATFIHNAYSGMEMMLKRILIARNIPVPHTESSHMDLIRLSKENEIISSEMMAELDGYRAFRHFFVHGYGVMLDYEQLLPLAEGLPGVWQTFTYEIDVFLSKK